MNGSTFIQLSEDSDNAFSDNDSEFERILKENHEAKVSQPTQVQQPTHHQLDYNELSKYIYPINFELRDYQYNIVRKAFYDNLLVALPTGLGKTFIASTVILNFSRWFPESKLIFMAPTRPLVAQQLKACCSIAGVPASKVAILLDKTRKNRQEIWDSKSVFFTTPQVVENDLCSGILHPKSIALLVIDEAHRARGNYAYHNVVKFLNRFNNSYRILALTATPASDIDGVQEVIDNLGISKVEVRTENSIDIIKYMKRKRLVRRNVSSSNDIETLVNYLSEAIAPVLKTANDRKVLDTTDPSKINFFKCMEASKRVTMNQSIPQGLKWSSVFILQLLGVVGQSLRKLNIYGIKSFYSYFSEKHLEFTTKHNAKKVKNKVSTGFYQHPAISELLKETERILKVEKYSHPKMEALMEELEEFFTINNNSDSKVIIFTEFRESALEIVQLIEKSANEATSGAINDLKPHIFIGQAKEKEKFDEEKYLTKSKPSKKIRKDDLEEERNTNRTSSEAAQTKGMNQKLQKQVIKQFKAGLFNILVATSIGEEGLDIGEVDLIICYDSTASPIKNIQRMGRTGRKREGKVVLLFSGNEESKFDKAMGGYEYIQQHIMKGQLITLGHANRMLPAEFEPEVVQQLIEMPEENLQLKQVEDEDEIIKIATQYMLDSTSKRKKTKPKKKAETRFFMPDNVETNFRSVKSMLQDVSDSTQSQSNNSKHLESSSQERSVLESILYSDDDDDDDDEIVPGSTRSNDSSLVNDSTYLPSSAEKEHAALKYTPTNTTKRSLPSDDCSSSLEIESTPDPLPSANTRRLGVRSYGEHAKKEVSGLISKSSKPSLPPKKKTLGMKKARVATIAITDLLKGCKPKSRPATNEVITIEDDAILDIPLYVPISSVNFDENSKKENIDPYDNAKTPVDDDDYMFDDGLDEELALISSNNMTSNNESEHAFRSRGDSQNKSQQGELVTNSDIESLYKNDFDPDDGLLNDEQKMELYTSYYSCVVPASNNNFDPYESLQGEQFTSGSVGHSRITNDFKRLLEFESKTNEAQARRLITRYRKICNPNKKQ